MGEGGGGGWNGREAPWMKFMVFHSSVCALNQLRCAWDEVLWQAVL